jgi:hypothetical protein
MEITEARKPRVQLRMIRGTSVHQDHFAVLNPRLSENAFHAFARAVVTIARDYYNRNLRGGPGKKRNAHWFIIAKRWVSNKGPSGVGWLDSSRIVRQVGSYRPNRRIGKVVSGYVIQALVVPRPIGFS